MGVGVDESAAAATVMVVDPMLIAMAQIAKTELSAGRKKGR
jgi:hypothetical protein